MDQQLQQEAHSHRHQRWETGGWWRGQYLAVRLNLSEEMAHLALRPLDDKSHQPQDVCGGTPSRGLPPGTEGWRFLSRLSENGMEYRIEECHYQEIRRADQSGTGQ